MAYPTPSKFVRIDSRGFGEGVRSTSQGQVRISGTTHKISRFSTQTTPGDRPARLGPAAASLARFKNSQEIKFPPGGFY